MTIEIPDHIAVRAHATERDVLIDVLALQVHRRQMFKHEASGILGISRDEFDHELMKRGLPTHTITAEDYREDIVALESLRGRH